MSSQSSTTAIRASVACNLCRGSKLKCINNSDSTRCQRCTSLDLECTYTLKTSQLKKRKLTQQFASKRPLKSSAFLPEKKFVIEASEIFFENQYKGIFPLFHKPSFFKFLRSDDFDPQTYIEEYVPHKSNPDPVILLSILALCARLHPELPKIYGQFDEAHADSFFPAFNSNTTQNSASNASKYFGWHARKLIRFDEPSIERVQALCILSSHEWGEGNASRSYMYVGIAARMALILGLNNEPKPDLGLSDSENFIRMEMKRRAMWSVYMMDRCNSCGRSSHSCISLDQIHVRLPCSEKEFIFGIGKEQPFRFDHHKELSLCAYQIVLFETWRDISIWVSITGAKLEKIPPWEETSPYYILSKKLDAFEEQLPAHLKFSEFNLQAHIADGSVTDYAYFSGLFLLCRTFLNREYFYSLPEASPTGWWHEQASVLFDTLDKLDQIPKILKPLNLMVIAPFTGFHVFTAAATGLYIGAYPKKVMKTHFSGDIIKKYQALAEDNLNTLSSWLESWGLGQSWINTLKEMKEVFARSTDYDQLRFKMRDYGNIDKKPDIQNLLVLDEAPILNFMNNLDLTNIFPDWSGAMNI
ncbi:putative transcriptional regulatory protein PB1A11.04c [Candida viswanathii]|uniref:Putative transcriptional regulatory protein PB1A11.04c n=2 Tax=Candida TaxID=5475 RepID=A0A367YA81_9ASCO|nr:putative transcriptional regulatory protein PB1A11.04c [Candida viswanathii]